MKKLLAVAILASVLMISCTSTSKSDSEVINDSTVVDSVDSVIHDTIDCIC